MLQNVRLDAVREERRRFANELHDVVANHLNAATLFLTAARQSLPPGEVRDLIDHAATGVRECWSDAHRCAQGLRPFGLMDRELTAVLSDYARHLSIASGINVTFASSGSPMPLSEDTKLAFLRVTQEAATNAIRHAHPTSVFIELHFTAGGVRLNVSDDGPGFNTAHGLDGIGLSAMHDRARQIGAKWVIRSDPSHGTEGSLAVQVSE
jgi:signal transduction histidine kinase